VFEYDSLSRLDRSTRNGSENLNVEFDAIGNITLKGGQTYLYRCSINRCAAVDSIRARQFHRLGLDKPEKIPNEYA